MKSLLISIAILMAVLLQGQNIPIHGDKLYVSVYDSVYPYIVWSVEKYDGYSVIYKKDTLRFDTVRVTDVYYVEPIGDTLYSRKSVMMFRQPARVGKAIKEDE